MAIASTTRWYIERIEHDEADAGRWIWRRVESDGKLSAISRDHFKTFLECYADAKRHGMDAHDFMPRRQVRSA